jgi:hypothetical protein
MKKRWLRGHGIVALLVGALVFLTVGGVSLADVVTANLKMTPTPCKRGDVLHFTATIFNNPIIPTLPGTAYYGAVVLDNTNHPELDPWHSELEVFKYPYEGKTATINFTNTYTVPFNLQGTDICFYVTEGSQMTNKISYKHCIMVKALIFKKKLIIKELQTPK